MRDRNVLETVGAHGQPHEGNTHPRFPYHMGVELELENVEGQVAAEPPRGWTVHVDPSLRNGGLEFVFAAPYKGADALVVVDHFYNTPGRYTGGARTSTHVHVNAQMLSIGALRAIVAMSYVVEDALFAHMKQYRRWCGYCMPLSEMSPARLRAVMLSENPGGFYGSGIKAAANADKYYGLNISSLRKHGTLEFRYFPGAPSKEELLSWMDYCTEMFNAGIRLGDADAFTRIESAGELAAFITSQLPLWGEKIVAAVGAEALYEKLADLQFLLEKEYVERVKRKDPLVFVSPQLIGLACRLFGTNKETRDNISQRLRQLKVMSHAEWVDSIVYARNNKPAPAGGNMFYKRAAAPHPEGRVVRQADVQNAIQAYQGMIARENQAPARVHAGDPADPEPIF